MCFVCCIIAFILLKLLCIKVVIIWIIHHEEEGKTQRASTISCSISFFFHTGLSSMAPFSYNPSWHFNDVTPWLRTEEGEVTLFPLFPTTQLSSPASLPNICVSLTASTLSPIYPLSVMTYLFTLDLFLLPASICPSTRICPWPVSPCARLFYSIDGEPDIRP